MGQLVDGKWEDTWYDTASHGGAFKRQDAAFRGKVTADGSSGHPAAPGRYHLYVSLACPWSHRVALVRALKGLEAAIPMTVVSPHMLENGWAFAPDRPDPVLGSRYLYEVYLKANPRYSGRVTVPVLWDCETHTLVCNESSELMRMFNREFDAFATTPYHDLYPEALRPEIDAMNKLVYDAVNNGVYRAGFATSQSKYTEAFVALFAALDQLEAQLADRPFLLGDRDTEADWRLFPTLARFDAVYHGHFKCNLRRLVDYPNLWAYTRRLHAIPGVAATVDIEQCKQHYYVSHRTINPTGIVPRGPDLRW